MDVRAHDLLGVHRVLAIPAHLVREYPGRDEWFLKRFEGNWSWISALLLFGHLFSRFSCWCSGRASGRFGALTLMAIWFLVIQYIDCYWQVMPNFYPKGIAPHWLDIVCVAAPMSALGLVFWSRMRAHALMPIGDPRFEQALSFQNA